MRPEDTAYPDIPWVDPEHMNNRDKVPLEELLKHANQHVAWNWEGTQIVANGAMLEEVFAKLDAAGINQGRVVHSFVEWD